jgi:predicted CoA-binding protein
MPEKENTAKKTLVLGASSNPGRYSYMAVQKLREKQIPVTAVGNRHGYIGDVPIHTEPVAVEDIDTISLYLNAEKQVMYYDYILSLKPRRILFNPGTENPDLEQRACQQGIATLEACTLVLLGIGRY